MAASGSRKQTQDSRGGGSDGTTCSLPIGIRTGPVTNDVVADSRDQPNKRAHSTNAGTVTTTHGLPTRIARNARAGPVPSTCEAAQPPRPLTRMPFLPTASSGASWHDFVKATSENDRRGRQRRGHGTSRTCARPWHAAGDAWINDTGQRDHSLAHHPVAHDRVVPLAERRAIHYVYANRRSMS